MEHLSIILEVISAAAVVISILYLAKRIKLQTEAQKLQLEQLKQQFLIHSENHEWSRRIETQKALDSYNRLEAVLTLNEKFSFLSEKHAIPLNTILNVIQAENDHGIKVHLSRLLNYYENLSNGVDLAIYDEEIIKSARRNVMIRTHTAFSEYMDYERRERNSLAYTKFGALVNKWEKQGEKSLQLNKLGEKV